MTTICLFDIDGTMIDTGGAGQAAMLMALKAEFDVPAPTGSIPTAGRTDCAIVVDLFSHYGITDSAENRKRLLTAYLDRLPDQLRHHDGVVLPGIRNVLDLLRGRDDVVSGLLTGNYEAAAYMKLDHFQLADRFRFGAFGDDHQHRDDVARQAARQFDRHVARSDDVSRVLVIGDTPADVQCAAAIGAESVAVATGRYSHAELEAVNPHHLFTDLADVDRFEALLSHGRPA